MVFQAPPPETHDRFAHAPQLTLDDLAVTMSAFGLRLPGQPIADGEIQRVPVASSKTNNDIAGWYVIFIMDNGLVFADYGDWRTGKKAKWSSREPATFTAEENAEFEQHKVKVKAERDRQHGEAAKEAYEIWMGSLPSAPHDPYLLTKHVQPHGTKIAVNDGRLIIPVMVENTLWSLQYIDANGNKRFHPGSKVNGGYYKIDGAQNTAVVAEGFSTAATIAEATGYTTYCAFNAGNLEKVVSDAKRHHTKLLIAGDDDKWTDGNPGRKAAEAAARKHSCSVVFPTVSNETDNPTDFNDMAAIDGIDAVRTAIMAADTGIILEPRFERLRPLTLEQLKNRPPRTMLVKGLLGVGEMSVWIGEPKCGKSFLVTHLGLAVATGQEWCGKKVKQGPVVYIVAEGAGGFAKRIDAHRQHHGGIDEAPFFAIPTGVNLLDADADIVPLIYWVKEHGAQLVVIDTLSRTMAGGNENGPEDMGAYIANCDRIREETGAHVLIVHHKPKGKNNTPRGHSSLFGAVDALVLIEKRQTGNVATVEASKDEEDGWQFGFNLKVVEVSVDEDGEPITSCVVVVSDEAPAKKEKPLTGDKSRAMDALYEVLITSGKIISNRHGIPDGANCVGVEAWRQEFYARKEGNPETKQKAFKRAMNGLYDIGKVAYRDGYVWAVSNGEQGFQLART